MRSSWPGFVPLLALSACSLVGLLVAALLLPGPWSWILAVAWIVYDTWLHAYHVRHGVAAARRCASAPAVAAGPRCSILVAAHDEETAIVACLDRLSVREGDQILVLDDGSADGTAARVVRHFSLSWDAEGRLARRPGCPVTVHALPRGGKACALNHGLAHCSGEIVLTIDADTHLEPGALEAVRAAFAADPDLQAACGILTPTCEGGGLARALAWFQAREYARAFLWRAGWAAAGSLVLVSGAFAAFRRETVLRIGGFDAASPVEDYELMYRLHDRHPGARCAVLPLARASTDAPAGLRAFLRQRARWFGGFISTLHAYRHMVGDRRLGRLGGMHLRLKTIDMLLPVYALAALAVLAVVCWREGGVPLALLLLLLGKLAVDAVLQVRAARAYARWLGRPPPPRLTGWVSSMLEQVLFQPVRQLGAVLGWWRVLRGAGRRAAW